MILNIFVTLLFAVSFCFASDQFDISFYRASQDDIKGLCDLVQQIPNFDVDCQKVVVLPLQFQESSIKKNVELKRLFVAKQPSNDQIVGYKKLFVIQDEQELNDIRENEIRCMGPLTQKVDSALINIQNTFERISRKQMFFLHSSDLYLYTGADYVLPEYRQRGINTLLYDCAFNRLQNKLAKIKKAKNSRRVILLYGLTHLNDYDDGGNGISRTPSIAKAFYNFLKHAHINVLEFSHHRYRAFMPTFDLQATECVPLSDDKAIPGYGNVLVAHVNEKD
jgi:hypothetical protein